MIKERNPQGRKMMYVSGDFTSDRWLIRCRIWKMNKSDLYNLPSVHITKGILTNWWTPNINLAWGDRAGRLNALLSPRVRCPLSHWHFQTFPLIFLFFFLNHTDAEILGCLSVTQKIWELKPSCKIWQFNCSCWTSARGRWCSDRCFG